MTIVVKIKDMYRTGLLPEHAAVRQGTHEGLRLTVPAREALERVGASIIPGRDVDGVPIYTVEVGNTVPQGIVAVSMTGPCATGLRLANEPPYPQEFGVDYWMQVDMTPCPRCGATLVWYEAGYVPGYRVCARKPHHHMLAQ